MTSDIGLARLISASVNAYLDYGIPLIPCHRHDVSRKPPYLRCAMVFRIDKYTLKAGNLGFWMLADALRRSNGFWQTPFLHMYLSVRIARVNLLNVTACRISLLNSKFYTTQRNGLRRFRPSSTMRGCLRTADRAA
jgi:hypothetical protein